MWSSRSAVFGLATLAIALGPHPRRPDKGANRSRCTRSRAAPTRSPTPPGARARRRAPDGDGHQGRRGADRAQRAKLAASGVRVDAQAQRQGPDGQPAGRAPQAVGGFNVWRSWDEPGGIRDELHELARAEPAARQARGAREDAPGPRPDRAEGHAGRARTCRDGSRPAVLYSSTQHAREWISLEVNRRLLHHFVDRWRANDKEIKDAAQEHRVVVRDRRRTRTATSTRSTTSACGGRTCATTTATARSPSATASIPTATSTSTGATTTRAPRPTRPTRPTAGPSAASEPETRAHAGADRPHQAEVPVEPALVRRVAAVPAGLAGRHARRRQPGLCRGRRHRRQSGDPGLQPGPVGRHAVRDQRRDDGLRRHQRRHGRLHARARRGRRRAPASCSPTTRRWSRRSSRRRCRSTSGWPARRGDPPTRSRRSASTSSRSTSTRTTSTRRTGSSRCSTSSSASPTATRRRCACSPSAASAPSRSSTRSTAARCTTSRRRSGPAASATGPATAPTTTSCSGEVTGTEPGDSVKVWFEGGGADERLVHLHGRSPTPAGGC